LLADRREGKAGFFKGDNRDARTQGIKLPGMDKRTDQFTTTATGTFFWFHKQYFAHTFLIPPCAGKPVLTLLLLGLEEGQRRFTVIIPLFEMKRKNRARISSHTQRRCRTIARHLLILKSF
jgi:hypothetical protein